MKRVIGVMPLWDESKSSIWMLPGYVDAIRECGAVPIIFPLIASEEDIVQLCQMCDGFLLTGGEDVNPEIYGDALHEKCGVPNHDRDMMERIVLNYAIEHDRPLLGICRGIQIINSLLGGTLYQDLPSEYDSDVSHQMSAPYDREWHGVRIIENTPLSQLSERLDIMVNSYHHQAVKELSADLLPMAISEDGLVEAVYMPNKRFVQAIQWHPELSFKVNELSREIFRSFVAHT